MARGQVHTLSNYKRAGPPQGYGYAAKRRRGPSRPGIRELLRMVAPHIPRAIGTVGNWYRSRGTQTKKRVLSKPRVSGTIGPRFKKGYKPKMSYLDKFGATVKQEKGAQLTDPNVVYVGHGVCPPEMMIELFIRSMMKLVMGRAGFHISNWEDSPKYTDPTDITFGVFHYVVMLDTNSAELTQGTTLLHRTGGVLQTWEDHFVAIRTNIYLAIVNADNPQFVDAWIVPHEDSVVNAVGRPTGVTDLRKAKVHFKGWSKLNVQNQTEGQTLAEDTTDAVTNNPLTGRIYTARGAGLQFPITDDTAPQDVLICNQADGRIQAVGANLGPQQFESLRRPPPGKYMPNCKTSRVININPGVIRTDHITHDFTMSLASFTRLLVRQFNKPNFIQWSPLGKASVLGLEKKCRTGGVASVIVGYELTQTLKMAMSASNEMTVPKLYIR